MQIVDPANPIPKYLQISAWLSELIQSGRFKAGEKLPSEIELAKMCQVNRNTLRQAIGKLASEGILKKEKGRGTFVSCVKPISLKHKMNRISSFKDDLLEAGISEETVVISKGIEEADEQVVQNLILGEDNRVVAVRRLRTGNGIPFIYEESFLVPALFRDILDMDLTGSMYRLITERFNVELHRSDQMLRAINFEPPISTLLKVPKRSAGFFMESLIYDPRGMPLELLYSYYRGDKYVFEVELGRYHIQ